MTARPSRTIGDLIESESLLNLSCPQCGYSVRVNLAMLALMHGRDRAMVGSGRIKVTGRCLDCGWPEMTMRVLRPRHS